MKRIVRSEKELETLNEKLSAELEEKRISVAKLTDQLECSQTELDQLKLEHAKVSHLRSVCNTLKSLVLET